MINNREPILKSKCVWNRGKPSAIESESPLGNAAVVFEDDGNTGYLYAIDRSVNQRDLVGNRTYIIVDSLHIYDVTQNQSKPTIASLIWSNDGMKVALELDKEIHAVFDFNQKKGCCLSGYPSTNEIDGGWRGSHIWDPAVLQWFNIGHGNNKDKKWWKFWS